MRRCPQLAGKTDMRSSRQCAAQLTECSGAWKGPWARGAAAQRWPPAARMRRSRPLRPCCPPPAAGSLTLDLVEATGTDCGSNAFAVCLSSFRIDIAADCAASVAPLSSTGVYVPGIWSSNPSGTYKRLVQCPTSARAAVTNSGSPSDIQGAIKTALEQHIYGSDYTLGLSSVAWSSGTVTLNTATGSCALKYGITNVRCAGGAAVLLNAPHMFGSAHPAFHAHPLPPAVCLPAGAARCHELSNRDWLRRGARRVRGIRRPCRRHDVPHQQLGYLPCGHASRRPGLRQGLRAVPSRCGSIAGVAGSPARLRGFACARSRCCDFSAPPAPWVCCRHTLCFWQRLHVVHGWKVRQDCGLQSGIVMHGMCSGHLLYRR